MISATQVPWLNLTETAALLGVTFQTARKLIANNKLIYKRQEENGRFLVSTKSIIEYMRKEPRYLGKESRTFENGKPHPLMTYAEAGTYLRIGQSSVRKMVDNGELTRKKIGRKVFVTRVSVTDYLQKVLTQ